MTPRGYLNLALLLLGGALLWWAGDSLYDAGVSAERGRWESAAAKAAAEDRKAEQQATTTSESIADTTRAEAGTAVTETRTETATSIGKITHAYSGRPLPCPVGPVAVLPDGVREELEAGHAALAAAAGRLPADSNARPGTTPDGRP